MELRRATRKDFKDAVVFGTLPDGTAPYISTGLRVEGDLSLAGSVDVMETEEGGAVAVYVAFYPWGGDREGDVEESWSREVPTVSAALRLVGFLEEPLSRDTLSLLSFSRGL